MKKARQPQLRRLGPLDDRPRELGDERTLEAVSQRPQPFRLAGAALERELHRLGEADDARDVLGPGAHAALLPAAAHERAQRHVVGGPEKPHLLGAVDLRRGEREQVAAERAHVHAERAGGL